MKKETKAPHAHSPGWVGMWRSGLLCSLPAAGFHTRPVPSGQRCCPLRVSASAEPRRECAAHRAGVKASREGRCHRQARSLERWGELDRGCKLDLRSVGDSPSYRLDSRASALPSSFSRSLAARLPGLTYARRCLGLGHGGIGGCPPHLRLGYGPPAAMPIGLRQDSDGRRSR
jgi:hypothetical protein